MSDQNTATAENTVNTENNEDTNELQKPDEMTMLKERATALGLKYSNSIGIDTLRQRVNDAMNDKKPSSNEDNEEAKTGEAGENTAMSPAAAKAARRAAMRREQLRLVRVRIACLNPDKKELQGEILCVANKFLGEVKKFIPYGEATDDGYHVPYILYNQLKSRKFLQVKTRRNRQNGQIEVDQRWVPEFAIEVLDPLTKEDLKELAAAQAAAGGVS